MIQPASRSPSHLNTHRVTAVGLQDGVDATGEENNTTCS